MFILFFSGTDPDDNPADASFGGPDLESGLDALSNMVGQGWQLTSVEPIDGFKPAVTLPPQASTAPEGFCSIDQKPSGAVEAVVSVDSLVG